MNKEVYFWVLFFLAVTMIALYFRYEYRPPIGIVVIINQSAVHSIYPFQSVSIPIQVSNTGYTNINDIGLVVLINGNHSAYYTVTLPAGKSTVFDYNFSTATPGEYNISVIADPGKLYNIVNRKATASSMNLDVLVNESANPFLYMPGYNASSKTQVNLNLLGLEVMDYLKLYYNFTLPNFLGKEIGFVQPLLNLTLPYIRNVSVGEYRYENGSSAYMLMIRGYVSPSIISTAAEADNLRIHYATILGENVTEVKINNTTTSCSWYSGGWLKNLFYFGGNCTEVISKRYNSTFANPYTNLSSRVFGENETGDLLSYTHISRNNFLIAKIKQIGTTIYVFTIKNSNVTKGTCFGVIANLNGTSFCSEMLTNETGGIGKEVSVMKTTELTSNYNATVFSIFNTSKVYATEASAIGLLKEIQLNGTPVSFVSGIASTCSFINTFNCSNVSFSNSILSATLTNLMNRTIEINNITCYHINRGLPSNVIMQFAPGESKGISIECFNGTSPIMGIPLGLRLSLIVDYTVNGTKNTAFGSAYIPIG